MKKQSPKASSTSEEQRLLDLSESVGDFMRYWGFRRIHGQIWAQVFLSKKHLSGAELTERLGVSKALVSPALTELEEHGLIKTVPDGLKVKRYTAESDVIGVIKNVLKKREAHLIKEALQKFKSLEAAHQKRGSEHSVLQESRMEELGKMIELAHFALTFLVDQLQENAVDHWVEVAQEN